MAVLDQEGVLIRNEVTVPARGITLRLTLLIPANSKIPADKTVELPQDGKAKYLHFRAKVPFAAKYLFIRSILPEGTPNPGRQGWVVPTYRMDRPRRTYPVPV